MGEVVEGDFAKDYFSKARPDPRPGEVRSFSEIQLGDKKYDYYFFGKKVSEVRFLSDPYNQIESGALMVKALAKTDKEEKELKIALSDLGLSKDSMVYGVLFLG